MVRKTILSLVGVLTLSNALPQAAPSSSIASSSSALATSAAPTAASTAASPAGSSSVASAASAASYSTTPAQASSAPLTYPSQIEPAIVPPSMPLAQPPPIACPGGEVIFYEKAGFQGQGISHTIVWEQVQKIKSPEITGGEGSSWKVNGASLCQLFETEDGTGPAISFLAHADNFDGYYYGNSNMHFPRGREGTRAKSFKCKNFHAINGACQYASSWVAPSGTAPSGVASSASSPSPVPTSPSG